MNEFRPESGAAYGGGGLDLPRLNPGAARAQTPGLGEPADMRACGLPAGLPHDWQEGFAAGLVRAAQRYRSFRLFLEACTRCGACAQACPFFLGTGDPVNIPASRASLAGLALEKMPRPIGWDDPAKRTHQAFDRELLSRWYTYFHQCSMCRACAQACPFGIDTSEVTRICREILAEVGMVSQSIAKGVANTLRFGNHLGVGPDEWAEMNRGLEKELRLETGLDIKCPVDEYGADVLLAPPASDLVYGKGVYKGYAKVFHATGVSWTTSTYASDAANLGAFLNYRNLRMIHQRVLEAARELRPKYIIWGESGHGWRVARSLSDTLDPGWQKAEFLEVKAPVHMIEWTHHKWTLGAFEGRLHKDANDGMVPTYHDSCHLSRSCGLVSEPRTLILASCHRFAEMPMAQGRGRALCCGGGGGLTGREQRPLRLAAFLHLGRALAEAQRQNDANWVVTACHDCRRFIGQGVRHYGLAYAVGGVHELFGRALYPPRGKGA